MSWEQLAAAVVRASGQKCAKVRVRGNSLSVRFGIPHDHVVRRYTAADEWLVVRRVYTDGYRWNRVGLTMTSPMLCARVRSRPRLEGIIRSMCMGASSRGEPSYIEVIPWREDDKYPPPRPYDEVQEEVGWE